MARPSELPPEMLARFEELRQEVLRLREQQEALAQGVQELLATFRRLAIHLGIATDAYRPNRGGAGAREPPPPGFA